MKKIYTLFLCLCLIIMINTSQAQPGSLSTGVTIAALSGPIVVDGANNLYLRNNSAISKFAPGSTQPVITNTGEGDAFTVDLTGNIYIANNSSHQILKFVPGSTEGVAVVAVKSNADLYFPQLYSLGVDGAGNLYTRSRDFYDNRIRKFTQGSSNEVFATTGPNLLAAGTSTSYISNFFVDTAGNIYVSDNDHARVIKISPSTGVTTVVAGGNGKGSAANQLSNVSGVFADAAGTVFVADAGNHRIQKWTSGALKGATIAGGNGAGSAPNQLNAPSAVCVDGFSNIYVADAGNGRIQKFSVPTAQGSTAIGVTVAGGNGAGTMLNQVSPTDVVVDAGNNVYAVDNNNYRVLKFAPNNQQGVVVAGGNGAGAAANQLGAAHGITLNGENNVYVADYANQRIQQWAPGTTQGTLYSSLPNATPQSVVFDATGNMYVLDFYNTKIFKYPPGSLTGKVIASSTELSTPGVSTNFPEDMAVDGDGNIYVIDRLNQRVVKWTPGSSSSIVVAGGNGEGAAANQLHNPGGIFVDNEDNVYVADTYNNRIQKWEPASLGGFTVAGGNGAGSGETQLSSPTSVFVDTYGNLYVGDGANNRVQKFGNKSIGLTYKYYEGSYNTLPDFTTLAPFKTGITSNVNTGLRPSGRNNDFAFLWEGKIKIPSPGTYTFETISDDGSRLYFNTQYAATATPTVNNDGVHSAASVKGIVNVDVAGSYPIAISYFQQFNGQTMQVYWTGPGIARQLIPDSAFVSSAEGDNTAPGTPTNVHVVSKGGNYIGLDWDNSTDNNGVKGYNVYVDGVIRFTSLASELIATGLSPNTSYTFTVKATDLAGNASALSNAVTETTSASVAGLTYKYYEGGKLVKTGVSPNVDISVRPEGRNDNFSFVWEGYITITTPGNYTFETISDDGSSLYFNSLNVPTVDNGKAHPALPAFGNVNITAAGVYPIAITYFEGDGSETMQVYWQGPGIQRQPIPDEVFVQSLQGTNLNYKYYEGTGWTTLPDFSKLTALKTGKTSTVDIGIRPTGVNDNFGFVWEGYINIPVAGNYTFETVSDDGSKLYFNSHYSLSATPLVNNDGLHATTSATGTVYVAAAGVYPIAITYFEKDGGEAIQVYWSGPGIDRQLIPAAAFVAAPSQFSGVKYKYYEGSWTTLPDFSALSPVKTGNTPGFDISVRPTGVNDNFGFVWEAYINIPTTGFYAFETISDDGSKLYFNSLYSSSATPTVNNDGLHAASSATGVVHITAAGSYPIAVTFFEKDGGESLQVYWSGPGTPRQLIPANAFVQPVPLLTISPDLTNPTTLNSNTFQDEVTGNTKISKVYPDPFIDRFKVDFYNSSNTNDISVIVSDINGRLIHTYRPGKLVAGNNSITISLNKIKLSVGTYFVTLQANGKVVKTLKLLKR